MHATDLTAIFEVLAQARSGGEPAVLATVVTACGSRRCERGSRLLILHGGRRTGTINGGDQDAELGAVAWQIRDSEGPVVLAYAMSDADELHPRDGAGAVIRVEILIEPVPAGTVPEWLAFLVDCERSRTAGVVLTVYRVEGQLGLRVGDRLLVPEGGPLRGSLASSEFAPALADDARCALREGRSDNLSFGVPCGLAEILMEVVTPPRPNAPQGDRDG